MTHRDPSVPQVDAVSEDTGERNLILVGGLSGRNGVLGGAAAPASECEGGAATAPYPLQCDDSLKDTDCPLPPCSVAI